MLNMRNTILIFIFLFAFVVIPFSTQAQTPQEMLNQYISELQKNPNDNALREKIIKHVQTMKPAPAIPEEAKKYMARGKAAFKGAKEINDFNDAASEFQKALLAAPWLAEGYYNLGIVQDKAGQHNAAKQSLKLYLAAAPNAPDAEKVKELIYEIDYRQEKAAKESSPAVIAEKKQKEDDEFIKKLNGVRFVTERQGCCYLTFDIQGNKVTSGYVCIGNASVCQSGAGWQYTDESTLHGREFTFGANNHPNYQCCPRENCKYVEDMIKSETKGKISNDGYTITTRNTCGETKTYRRER
jgi:tetratricopeptide (TPR) repeat protein